MSPEFGYEGVPTPRIHGESEGLVRRKPRLQVFADLRSGESVGETGNNIVEGIKKLSEPSATRQEVQASVHAITHELLQSTYEKEGNENILLVPVLRSGITMWETANNFFNAPETSFLTGDKEKGTNKAYISWTKRNAIDNKKVIILDPIIATGDTLIQAYEAITSTSEQSSDITIFSCYASPQGVEAVLTKAPQASLIVGCMAESVDADGYLIPSTNGDMGHKLFGKVINTKDADDTSASNEINPQMSTEILPIPLFEAKPDLIPRAN